MKPYVRRTSNKAISHTEDVKKIREYLEELGTLYIKDSTLESFFYEFSDEKYSAGWIGVDEVTLEEFEEWLSEIEL